eukprot:scaffold172_cov254-Pinguiococcus_pyrenoidosus.AAC.10
MPPRSKKIFDPAASPATSARTPLAEVNSFQHVLPDWEQRRQHQWEGVLERVEHDGTHWADGVGSEGHGAVLQLSGGGGQGRRERRRHGRRDQARAGGDGSGGRAADGGGEAGSRAAVPAEASVQQPVSSTPPDRHVAPITRKPVPRPPRFDHRFFTASVAGWDVERKPEDAAFPAIPKSARCCFGVRENFALYDVVCESG